MENKEFVIPILEVTCLKDFMIQLNDQDVIKQNVAKNMAWLLANMCTHRDRLIEARQEDLLDLILDLQAMLLDNMANDDEIVQDCCWGLCSLLDNAEEDVIQLVIGHELQVYLKKFLFMEKGGVAMACM